MEETRMESAMTRLGTCEQHTPARLLRNMKLTVRSLETERARRQVQEQTEKTLKKGNGTISHHQIGDPKGKKVL